MNNLALKEFYAVTFGGTVLCFNAGFINVVTLAGSYSATVSHVTGNITRMAISMFQEDPTTLALVTAIVFSYTLGSFLAGFLVGDSRFQLGKSYGYALLIECGFLFISFLCLKKELVIGNWFAAFACGLQNAICTSYSGFAVRTTHMTGIVTDIGNILGIYCRKDATNADMWRLKVLIPLLVGYILGALAGQFIYRHLDDNAMLFPCIFVGSLGSTYLLLPVVAEAKKLIKSGILPQLGDHIPSPFSHKEFPIESPGYKSTVEASPSRVNIDGKVSFNARVDEDEESFAHF